MNDLVNDQSDWGRLRVTGADRQRFLQGMLSADVAAIAPDSFARATLLDVKGRVRAIVDVVKQDDAFVLLTEPATATKVKDILERHAIVDDVVFEPLDVPVHRVWSSIEDVWRAPPVFEARAGSPADELEVRRVEAGLPRYDVDVSEANFPFEAHLERAYSLKKGCYIGQEVLARADARGSVKKRLVGIALAGDGPVAPDTPLACEARPEAGRVTSSVVSPRFGPIALGYLHRSCWEPGTEVRAGDRAGKVVALPFGS